MKLLTFVALLACVLVQQALLSPISDECSDEALDVGIGISNENDNSNKNSLEFNGALGAAVKQPGQQAVTTTTIPPTTTVAEVKCQDISSSPVEHGNVTCPNGNSVGDSCSLSCDQDYSVDGASTVTCLSTGSWDASSIGSCVIITCGNPASNLSNGNITCSAGFTYGASCNISCDSSNGTNSTQCSNDGFWVPVPHCEAISSCGDPYSSDIIDWNCSNGNLVGSTCTAGCPRVCRSNCNTICQSDGTWFPADVSCEPPQ